VAQARRAWWTEAEGVGGNPRTRGSEIRSVSGLLAPCHVEFCRRCDDIRAVERAVHTALEPYRVSRGRELFRVAPDRARVEIERMAESHFVGASVPVAFKRRRRGYRARATRH
jgi:hypothetical protein